MNRRYNTFLFTLTALLPALASCGKDEEKQPEAGTVGVDCSPKAACNEPLECTEAEDGSRCTYPAGADCEPENADLPNGGCAESAECFVPEDSSDESLGTCLILEGEECDPGEPHCTGELVCAEMASGEHRCFGRVRLVGMVTDTSDGSPIEAAHVIGIDSEGSAATSVSQTDADGNYSLDLPTARNDDGSPVEETFTLNGSAQNYQPFPSGVRVALPVTTLDATVEGDDWVVTNALTDIGLIPLPAGERHTISGTIAAARGADAGASRSDVTGVLVVASDGTQAFSATTDKDGTFTIFNVEEGDYEVDAYAADLQVSSDNVSISGDSVDGVTLQEDARGTVTVSGNVQIVNAAGGSQTSVILVVGDTFDSEAARGEVPRGLRAPRTGVPDVTGDFRIEGVPDGTYVVLAAYENDGLVRDPDTNIAGTDFVTITVDSENGSTMTLSESFKVTEALRISSPGADEPEAVDAAPTLTWADDSSEDWYELRVFDAFGDEVWSNLEILGVSGSDEVSVEYGGPLEAGMYYQFRVQSWRQPGNGDAAPISATEDLRGVFFRPAP
jgi:hypothetical protein